MEVWWGCEGTDGRGMRAVGAVTYEWLVEVLEQGCWERTYRIDFASVVERLVGSFDLVAPRDASRTHTLCIPDIRRTDM